MKSLIKIILLVGLSLQSFYFYNIGMPLFSVIALILMIFFINIQTVLHKSNLQSLFLFLLFSSINFIYTLFFQIQFIDIKRCISFFLSFSAIIITTSFVCNKLIYKFLFGFIVIHLIFFFLQFFVHYFLHIDLDFILFFTGEKQRNYAGSYEVLILGELFRSSGLFIEPGTYVTFIAPIIPFLEDILLNSKIIPISKSKLVKFIYIISLISLFLSFSIFGIFFCFVIILRSKLFSNKFKLIFISFIILGSSSYIISRFFNQSSTENNGIGFRLEELYNLFNSNSKLSTWHFLGNSFFLNESNNNLLISNDTGLILYLFNMLGPFLSLIIFIICFKLWKKNLTYQAKTSAILILISKHSIFAPYFIFLISLIFNSKKIEKLCVE
jgi:hypothetical protein